MTVAVMPRGIVRLADLAGRFVRVAHEEGLVAAVERARLFIRTRAVRPLQPRPTRIATPAVTLEPVRNINEMRARGPTISILTPVYNTPAGILDDAIQSVLRQTYPNWELCICDDGSTSAETLEVLERYRGVDWRLRIVRAPHNLNIARATNLAAELATGEFVGFLDHDDVLEADALDHIVRGIAGCPEADLIYTDEDKIEPDGTFSEPYLKPDWSPEQLLSVMYILHFMVVRKRLFLEIGGLRHEYVGSQDYDLALRATARARRVLHIPRVLYHWRKIPGSAAAVVDAKPEALRNAGRALQEFVASQDAGAKVLPGLLPGTYRIDWPLSPPVPVTLAIVAGCRRRVVPGRGDILLVENFLDSIIGKSTYPNYRLLVVDDNGELPSRVRRKVEARGGRVVSFERRPPFSFAKKTNFVFAHCETEHVILLNDDLEVISSDWIEVLTGICRRPGVGVVGGKLLFPDGRIQHAGIALGVNGMASHLFQNRPADRAAYCGYADIARNYSAVTAAAMATRLSVVREVGGFDERLPVDYNDVDFCLRVRAAGYRIVYTPHAQLYHFEKSSLPRTRQAAHERDFFERRWRPQILQDPFYHPLLPRDRLDCELTMWPLSA
ncbi:MAG TPA: glycosyltransferase [Hyphomicrobiaceae bacterium]|nr:glycosyltransferase [Hyphomicrobiaceae bacterium]